MPGYCVVILLGYIFLLSDASDVAPYSLRNLNTTRQRRQTTEGGCTLPQYPDHGQWKLLNGNAMPGDKVPANSVIKFDCNSGYKLSIDYHYLVCDENWNSLTIPECEELCPPLYSSTTFTLKCSDRRGKEIKCSEATHGTYVEYTCAPFYETPFGYKKTLLCNNGKWNQRPICQPVCGKKITNDTKLLIHGSKPNEKLEYPWITTLYRKKKNESFKYICGGSILSLTVVLTAAHCVTNEYGDTLPKENYLLGAGKLYNKYKAPEDTKAQYLEISKIVVHKDYKANSRRYLADIALLVVKGEFAINETVQPVCFNNLNSIHLHPGSMGEISGWGLTEDDDISEKLRTLTIPYKYETTCAQELPREWADKFNLIDKLCAGFVNESKGVCEGDSGNGLVFLNPEDNRYYIHGIVSLGPMDNGSCNVQQNSLYTKVAFYYEYVDRLLTIYAPVVKDCKLPLHPQNGKWVIDNQKNEPGDVVSSNTILRIQCNKGFQLSTLLTDINCASAHNMPTCQALCPPLQFPKGTDYRCFNEAGQTLECLNSVDDTKLVYSCPKGYIIPAGGSTRYCKNGSWGTPEPECVLPNKYCGKKGNSHKGPKNDQLPINGLEYPWNVFLYHKDSDGNFKYICGATLLSNKVVLTTAVCVTGGTDNKIPEDKFQLGAGKKYAKYKDHDDVHTQYSNVSHIRIHDRYRGVARRYAADIAVIVAETPFRFNDYVQPICFNGVDEIQLHPGDLGVVQKFDEINEQKVLKIPYKIEKVCEQEFPKDFADKYNVPDKICAGLDNNDTERLCVGDSGKAYAVRNPEDDRYYIYGLVSVTHAVQWVPERICHNNALYTSVPFYYDFVNKALSDYTTDVTLPKNL